MQTSITRHSAAAKLELLPRGLLLVRFSGPLTAATLQLVKRRVVLDFAAAGLRGFVVDYSAAVVAVGDADLDRILEGEPENSIPSLPAALLVRPECNGLFKRHALRMAACYGISRRVFNAMPPACRWAEEAARRAQS